ncbi:unnamed protein product, partial [Aphanomyces euteiches]
MEKTNTFSSEGDMMRNDLNAAALTSCSDQERHPNDDGKAMTVPEANSSLSANRNVITQLRDQKKLIDRLKQEKAALEDQISLMQDELQPKQHMQHSLATSKQLHDNNLLPNLISDVPTDRTAGGN